MLQCTPQWDIQGISWGYNWDTIGCANICAMVKTRYMDYCHPFHNGNPNIARSIIHSSWILSPICAYNPTKLTMARIARSTTMGI